MAVSVNFNVYSAAAQSHCHVNFAGVPGLVSYGHVLRRSSMKFVTVLSSKFG